MIMKVHGLKGKPWSTARRLAYMRNPPGGWKISEDHKKKISEANYKGGGKGSKWLLHGYIILELPSGRRVREHRYVMERKLGRRLRADESVHHRNGDRADNRISNLQLMNSGEHTAHHWRGRRHSPEAKEKMSRSHTGVALGKAHREAIMRGRGLL